MSEQDSQAKQAEDKATYASKKKAAKRVRSKKTVTKPATTQAAQTHAQDPSNQAETPTQVKADGSAGKSQTDSARQAADKPTGNATGAIALILVLLLSAGLAWLSWQRGWWSLDGDSLHSDYTSQQAELERLQQQLAGLQQDLQQQQQDPAEISRAVQPLLDTAQRQTSDELDNRLEQQRNAWQQAINAQQQRLRDIESRMAAVGDQQQQTQAIRDRSQALNEIRLLLQHARQQLSLSGNADAAVAAYQEAERVLAAAQFAGASELRTALINERQAIQAVSAPDIDALVSELHGLQQAVDLWPLRGQLSSAPDAAAETEQSWLDKLGNSFGQLVQVRKTGEVVISVAEATLIRQQLALALQTSALLALQGRESGFQTLLDDARELLQQHFEPTNRGVTAALDSLQQMRDTPLVAAWPDLSESSNQLAQLRLRSQNRSSADDGAVD